MEIEFKKYQGTGNDFIIVDQLDKQLLNEGHREIIQLLCDRRFGIGADGLILLEKSDIAHFKMIYFNSDGNQSTMCGNGGRCIVRHAYDLGLFKDKCKFEAIDGMHNAFIDQKDLVHLQMQNVNSFTRDGDAFIINTGSPHYVSFGEDLNNIDVVTEARRIRYNDSYKSEGINVNFANRIGEQLLLRTYERGVEDETLSCGTGVTATALAASLISDEDYEKWHWEVESRGGPLEVEYIINKKGGFENIWLIGPAELVFSGQTRLIF